jgi:hypothetical protein
VVWGVTVTLLVGLAAYVVALVALVWGGAGPVAPPLAAARR